MCDFFHTEAIWIVQDYKLLRMKDIAGESQAASGLGELTAFKKLCECISKIIICNEWKVITTDFITSPIVAV